MTTAFHVGRAGRYLIGAVAVSSLAILGGAVPASAAPLTGTSCSGGVCITVNGTGLFVGSATVTNQNVPAGFGKIINLDAHTVHTSPRKLSPGDSFTFRFDREVNNNDQICGQVGNSAVPCVTVHS